VRWARRHEVRVTLLALAAGAPALLVALVLLMVDEHSAKVRWTFAALTSVAWLGGAAALHARVTRSLQVVSALLAALREEDYSLRGRLSVGHDGDALSDVMREINGLADTLREQRLGAFEADALLRKVMAEIDVAVLAFDAQGTVRLANRTAERLVAGTGGVLGRDAGSLGLAACLEGDAPRTVLTVFPGGAGALRAATQPVSPARAAAHADRADRPAPGAARGGAPGVAAAGARAGPRDQQFVGADPGDRGAPRAAARAPRRPSEPPTSSRTSRAASR
jgi:hypothetical protein